MGDLTAEGPPLHPNAAALAFLLGTWVGEGEGKYPSVSPFSYKEEVNFGHVGKPFLTYSQRTWALEDGRPLHSEVGFWRATPASRVELVLAHPTGVAEVEEGTLTGSSLELTTRSIGLSSTAKQVTALSRSLRVDGDILYYTLQMGAVGQPAQPHLKAELRRVSW
jgi:THAP4-like, heme-binding beta-barrel domain